MSEAARLNLTAYNGEDYIAVGTHHVSPDPQSATENISTWTIVFTVRASRAAASTLLGPVSCAIVDGPNGVYSVTLTAAQTLALGVGQYWCDFWRTDSGSQTELALGTFTILKSIKN